MLRANVARKVRAQIGARISLRTECTNCGRNKLRAQICEPNLARGKICSRKVRAQKGARKNWRTQVVLCARWGR